jgi:hypothetical protein
MNTELTFEAESFELLPKASCGPECECSHCQAHSGLASQIFADPELWAELEDGTGGALEIGSEEALSEDAPVGSFDCSKVATDCQFMTPGEERRVRRAGKPLGDLLDRTQGDPDKNLSLQLTDYDVNDWRAGQKERHQRGLERILQFIGERATQIAALPAGIEITITGSASRTGSKQYNDLLSCKRATCVANFLRNALSFPQTPGHSLLGLKKIKFTIGGEGFQKATCRGAECEVGEFRSVLVSVHRPGVPPLPIPVVPPGWDKYRIRCCSFKTESLGEALIGELIDRGINALPEPIKRLLNESETAKKVLGSAIKKLIAKLKDLLTKAPGAFGRLFSAIAKGLPIPVEFIRDQGVFQILERDKPNPGELILCYTGFGLRVKFPRSLPGIGSLLPEKQRNALKEFLKGHLKIEGLGVDIAFDVLSGKIPTIESTTPGPFTDFDVRPKIRIKTFEGPGEALKGLQLGTIFVGFSSRPFVRPDPVQRPKITCSRGCAPSLVPVTVGSGTGIEVVAPTKGDLVDGGCKCGPESRKIILSRVAANRALARQATLRRMPPRRVSLR